MQFSDTSGKSGILQECEELTGLGDGVITGDATLKARFTARANQEVAHIFAHLQTLTGSSGSEDTNYTSEQFSTFDIVNGQGSYTFTTDQAGNTITDITAVMILPAATSTEYLPLELMTLDHPRALRAMSKNPTDIGVPHSYLEKDLTVYFDVTPNYPGTAGSVLSAGGKLFYRLVPSYFVVGDTTKKPGFAEGYHRLVPLRMSLSWLAINKPEATNLIEYAMAEEQKLSRGLDDYTRQQNPTRRRVVGSTPRSRTRAV